MNSIDELCNRFRDVYINKHATVIRICNSFVNERVDIFAKFMGKDIPILNVNSFGHCVENLVFHRVYPKVMEFREGPPQSSPDFFGAYDHEFELKTFMNSPNFDIGNFHSYLENLTTPKGMYRKLFDTTYLVFHYKVDNGIVFKIFWELPVWKICSYNGKNGISAQIKRGYWYNIRPGTSSGFSDPSKTVDTFLDALDVAMRLAGVNESVIERIRMSRYQVFGEVQLLQQEEQLYYRKGHSYCIQEEVDSCLESLISEPSLGV